ncbi:MAG: hypothetical protein JWP13_828 [Candidatus Saccharibacteria bacterium]|nr:hypothetical protein [Candidatus Saccharibacteria bacterium]
MNQTIEERIVAIEARNEKVDNDKAWETSWTRRVGIMALTYVVVVLYLRFVVHVDPWINALVPVIGFLISSLTISMLKKYWLLARK